jgi:hypothetical protein
LKICEIEKHLNAQILTCHDLVDRDVVSACGSDMMSDVLAFVKDQAVLLTGLVNSQVVRTALMMDMLCIVFVRNKKPTQEILDLATDNGIVVMTTEKRMYDACGVLYANGLQGEHM